MNDSIECARALVVTCSPAEGTEPLFLRDGFQRALDPLPLRPADLLGDRRREERHFFDVLDVHGDDRLRVDPDKRLLLRHIVAELVRGDLVPEHDGACVEAGDPDLLVPPARARLPRGVDNPVLLAAVEPRHLEDRLRDALDGKPGARLDRVFDLREDIGRERCRCGSVVGGVRRRAATSC